LINRECVDISPDELRHSVYSLEDFNEALEFAIMYESSVTSSRIYEYTATLITRMRHLLESDYGKLLGKTDFETVPDYIEDVIGKNQLLIIDTSGLDDRSTEIVSKVFSKMLFEYARGLDPRNSEPMNIILEEAHRYVKDSDGSGLLGYDVFERIAKEGRKYGLHMGILSQRPSELSKTVISQCSNFIIHRLQSPDDLNYVSKMVPYIDQSMVDRITYLPCGHALVFGTAINLPMLTSFELASPVPNSGNSDISKAWYIERSRE
jgi:DNA helicase HerA-like ATPase